MILADLLADERFLRRGGDAREGDLDLELFLHVVAPREHPRAEGDEEPEEEHPDENSHRRCERRRDVRGDRRPRFGEEETRAGAHSLVYPPRRSSRASRPSSSAITRLRILSTISRSCVTMRIVVPARVIR